MLLTGQPKAGHSSSLIPSPAEDIQKPTALQRGAGAHRRKYGPLPKPHPRDGLFSHPLPTLAKAGGYPDVDLGCLCPDPPGRELEKADHGSSCSAALPSQSADSYMGDGTKEGLANSVLPETGQQLQWVEPAEGAGKPGS